MKELSPMTYRETQETAAKLARRAMTHPNPQERERLRLLSAAAALLALQQQKAAYFARRAQHYEAMALSLPDGSREQRDLLMRGHAMAVRARDLAKQNNLQPQQAIPAM
jgi:hypothetical protein